jgi:transposase/predicted transcriptional regulator
VPEGSSRKEMHKLSPIEMANITRLHKVSGYGATKISQLLNLKMGTVNSYLSRTKKASSKSSQNKESLAYFDKAHIISSLKQGNRPALIAERLKLPRNLVVSYVLDWRRRQKNTKNDRSQLSNIQKAIAARLSNAGRKPASIATSLQVPINSVTNYLLSRRRKGSKLIKSAPAIYAWQRLNNDSEAASTAQILEQANSSGKEKIVGDQQFQLSVAKSFGYISAFCEFSARAIGCSEAKYKHALVELLQADITGGRS